MRKMIDGRRAIFYGSLMGTFRAKSFFRLVVTALVVVAMPLAIVLVDSEVLMSRLAGHSASSVYRSVSAGQLGQELAGQFVDLERLVRQYQVLDDDRLPAAAQGLIREIDHNLTEIAALLPGAGIAAVITEARQVESGIAARLARHEAIALDPTFGRLHALGRRLHDAAVKLSYDEAAALRDEAARARLRLLGLAAVMVAVTLGLVVYFSRLISRPIKEFDAAINRLGQGDFVSPVTVTGPQDLVFLGRRLEWLREKLAAFEKNKSKFAAHVSHELKTPLASIREGAELLADEVPGPLNGPQREIVGILNKNCAQLQALIENLIGFTMAEARKAGLHPDAVDVARVVEDVVAAHTPLTLKNEVTVVVAVDEVVVEADRELLRAIVNNLYSNAVKYVPPGGRIEVSAKGDSGELVLDVIDTGPGVGRDEEEAIFQPFFQGRATCRTSIKGTGLGLAMAREYARAHGGSLELVREQVEGSGAHFRVRLPLRFGEEDHG